MVFGNCKLDASLFILVVNKLLIVSNALFFWKFNLIRKNKAYLI